MVVPSGSDQEDGWQTRIGRRRLLGSGLAVGAALAGLGSAHAASLRPRGRGATAAGPSAARATPGDLDFIPQLPLRGTYPNLPAVPVDEPGVDETLENLKVREQQVTQAKQGLTERYTIGGVTRRGYAFLFGGAAGAGASRLSLETPDQFAISWTTFADVYKSGRRSLRTWTRSLTDTDAATKQFWPMVASHGLGYNLIVPERVQRSRGAELRREFGAAWTARVRRALSDGDLYVIDMSRFESLEPQTYNGATRFTPATMTLLIRDPKARSLEPVAVIVSGFKGRGRTVYERSSASSGAWLYALQAAKASITVYGVWLGHVYHWHIVTCAMQMTMFNTLPSSHPVYQLLAPQSNYAMAFDNVLLSLWSSVAPPTSLGSGDQFLALANEFADGRSYFDDDPKETIKQLGLRQRDFTDEEPWDKYPVVQRLLEVWDLVEPLVETFVRESYPSDVAVAADADLQAWIAASSSADPTDGGNIRGLPQVEGRESLERVLKSLVYRITVHGISRLNSTSNPALTFVPNFPHCLQRSDIPAPRSSISTRELLRYLPNTDAIAEAVSFYFVFAFSTPYVPLIPLGGVREELFFPNGTSDPRNRALIDLRRGMADFIGDLQPGNPQRFQWPRNIET